MSEYSPKDQALIDRVNAEHEAQSGKSRLWGWFGLSRASMCILPRVCMCDMPDDWQKRMAVCLEQFDEAFPNLHFSDIYVSQKRKGRFAAIEGWLLNYRHPDRAMLADARGPYQPKPSWIDLPTPPQDREETSK